jgi:hypothetical protein
MTDFRQPVRRFAGRLGIALALVVLPCGAAEVFVVNEPWVLPALRGHSTEAYVNLASSEGTTLVGVRSEVAERVDIREPGARSALAQLPLPAGRTVALAPGKPRIVLHNLVRSLALGDRVVFTMLLQDAHGTRREIAMDAEVRRRSPSDDHRHGHGHAHGAAAP